MKRYLCPIPFILLSVLAIDSARAEVNVISDIDQSVSAQRAGSRTEEQDKVDWAKLVFTGREQQLKDSTKDNYEESAISGFATWGVTHSNNRQADYHGSFMQPNGAGKSSPTMYGLDTKAGIQGISNISSNVVATIQIISDHRSDNSYTPEVEWANLKYLISPDLYVRIGRMNAPIFMISDYKSVGYAQLMVRPPLDMYSLKPGSRLDGGDIGAQFYIGEGRLNAQFSAGRKNDHQTVTGITDDIKLNGTYSIASFKYDIGSTSYNFVVNKDRALVSSQILDLYWNSVVTAGPSIGYPPETANMKPKGGKSTYLEFGFSHEPGDLIIQGEYVIARSDSEMIQAQNVGYMLAGYHIGKFTPYVAYSQIMSKQGAPRNSPACSPPSNTLLGCSQYANDVAVINMIDSLGNLHVADSTITLGARYDINKNLDMKVQFDRVSKPSDPAFNTGVFINYCQPSDGMCAKPVWGSTAQTVNLLTVTVDFVF